MDPTLRVCLCVDRTVQGRAAGRNVCAREQSMDAMTFIIVFVRCMCENMCTFYAFLAPFYNLNNYSSGSTYA